MHFYLQVRKVSSSFLSGSLYYFQTHMKLVERLEEHVEPGSSKATQSMVESFFVAPMLTKMAPPPPPPPPRGKVVIFDDDHAYSDDPERKAKRKVLAPETIAVDAATTPINCR